jgi:hypothetical protein
MVDRGELLQNVLSSLSSSSSLSCLEESPKTDDGFLLDWIWTSISASTNDSASPASTKSSIQWCNTLRLIRDEILPHISPLDLHAVASESIVFAQAADGSQLEQHVENEEATPTSIIPFRILCLHLCNYALQQCPTPLSSRFKRWQSIVCETIRLVQDFCRDSNHQVAVDMWVKYTCPTVLLVVKQLAHCNNQRDDIIHSVGIFAGLIGTTSCLAEKTLSAGSPLCRSLNSALLSTVQSICSFFEIFSNAHVCLDEWSVWSNPWRSYTWKQHQQTNSRRGFVEDIEDVQFETQRQDLSWWIYRAYKEDYVAQMETSWSTTGISCMSFDAFHDRPLVYHPTFLWKVWLPHATQMIKESKRCTELQDISFYFLNSLVNTVPVRSLEIPDCKMYDKSFDERPDVPYQIVHFLSVQAIVVSNRQGETSPDGDMQHRKHVSYTMGMIRELLNRYKSKSQVAVVEKLVHDCPNPPFQARFLDFLQPILLESECQDKLWRLLHQQLDNLLHHLDRNSQFFVDVEGLIQNVEIHVSTLSLIQRSAIGCFKKRQMTNRTEELRQKLFFFHRALNQQLDQWSRTTVTTTKPPDNFFRLNLLEGAFQNILTLLD